MAKTKKLTGRKRDERITAYMFVAPAVILLIAFLVVPMIYTVYFSGFKYQIMRPDAIKFIGLENYQKLFSDKNFWIALKNTVYFYSSCCTDPVCSCSGTCASCLKKIPGRIHFQNNVFQSSAYFHGCNRGSVVSSL